MRAASSCCDRLIDLTLSGYNPDVLPYAWLSLVCGVCNLEMPPIPQGFEEQKKADKTEILEATQEVISKVKKVLGEYWDFS